MTIPNPSASNAGPVLEACHIAKSYGRHEVLTDVVLQLNPGAITGIVGENGSGKSTLLNILVGLLPPSRGEVIRRARIGFCPQEPTVFETLSVRENFDFFATAYGMDPATAAGARAELLGRFRFAGHERKLVSQLSGGTRQKLNLSLALLHSPELLVLDEPYSGFDWETYLHFWSLTGELKAQGRCILIVSHLVFDRSKFDVLYELEGGKLRCV